MPHYGFGRCDDHHKIADFYSSTVHRTVILRETSPDAAHVVIATMISASARTTAKPNLPPNL